MTGRKADAVVTVLMNQKLNKKIILKSNLHVKQGLKLINRFKPLPLVVVPQRFYRYSNYLRVPKVS